MNIKGYVAYFGNIDEVGDIIDPKAFTATLADLRKHKLNIPVLREHNKSDIVGRTKSFKVDKKGLFCVIEIYDHFASKMEECKANKIRLGFSIGYRPTKYEDGGNPCHYRTLLKVALIEVSIVLWPANDKCIVNYIK